jgi:hypothetical protein
MAGRVATTWLVLAALPSLAAGAGDDATAAVEDWISLFNGRDLDGWTVKIRTQEAGVDPWNTFRVEDGVMTVAYDNYGEFDNRFGHIFYREPYSHYRLRLEYRFLGDPAPGTQAWAFRNSGAMLHSQAPETMPAAQNFPISIEFQFLGGLGDGQPRPTGNLCTPGTNVVYRGAFTEEHCIPSASPTFDGDQWVRAEALVLGAERVVHLVNGEPVIEYGGVTYGGGAVSGHDPEVAPDGQPLASGYISLQSEGHPIQFRNVELLNLEGCMDPDAANYRSYFLKSDPDSCRY